MSETDDTAQTPNGLAHDGNPKAALFTALPFILVGSYVLLFVYCAIFGEPAPINVSHEDGVLEWGTVYFFMVCGVFGFAGLYIGRGSQTRSQKIFLWFFVILMLLAVGEEISWGQRIFGWEVPEAISKEKGGLIQAGHKDTAVHNLSFRSKWLKFSLGGLVFGVVLLSGLAIHGIWLPIASRKGERPARWLTQKMGVFVPPLRLGILIFLVATVLHFLKKIENTESREYKEFLIPLVYAFMLVECYFRPASGSSRTLAKARGWLMVATGIWVLASVGYMLSQAAVG